MTIIYLRKISSCTDIQKSNLLKIRNDVDIRNNMFTDHIITKSEHLEWLECCENDPTKIIYLVLVDDLVRGMVALTGFDQRHLKSDWAFYFDKSFRGPIAAAVEYHFLNFVFKNKKIKKLNCQVIQTNNIARRLHAKFGFSEEGFLRQNIVKNGNRMGVYLLGLTEEDWSSKNEKFYQKYCKALSCYHVVIEA